MANKVYINTDNTDGAAVWEQLGLHSQLGSIFQNWDAFLDSIAALTDPDADRILFWDDSAGAFKWLTVGTGLTITDTTISASSGGNQYRIFATMTDSGGGWFFPILDPDTPTLLLADLE